MTIGRFRDWFFLDAPRVGVERICAGILTVFLLTSSLVHARNPYAFLSSIYAYEIVGPRAGLLIAFLLPAVLGVSGVGLLSGKLARGGYLCTLASLLLFAVAQVSAWARGIAISCGCFGADDSSPIGFGSLGLLTFLIGTALLGLSLQRPRNTALSHSAQDLGSTPNPARD